MHVYISTACRHDLCERCRLVCKFCDEPCLCLCHQRSKETAVTSPENIDNPVTPDVDVDPMPAEPAERNGDPTVPADRDPVVPADPADPADPDSVDAQIDPDDDLAPADDNGEGQPFSEPADGVQDDGA